jgi:hypothetical protein
MMLLEAIFISISIIYGYNPTNNPKQLKTTPHNTTPGNITIRAVL